MVEKSGVEKSGVERFGVEMSGVEMSFNLLKVINEDEEIYKTVIGDFVQRIQPQLRKFLKDPVNVDFHCALLRFVDEIMKNQDDEALNQLSKHYKDFKLLTSDRTEVCLIKCKILQKLYGD